MNASTWQPDATFKTPSMISLRALVGIPMRRIMPIAARLTMSFKPNQLAERTVLYSKTVRQQLRLFDGGPDRKGYNPTFDLWSTSGRPSMAAKPGWIKNW